MKNDLNFSQRLSWNDGIFYFVFESLKNWTERDLENLTEN